LTDADSAQHDARHVGLQLFALSFCALFLELMLIRWVPAVVRMVAYYANLMLISSFLGLGVGALMARRWRDLFRWFPVLFVVNVAILLACGDRLLAVSGSEARFFTDRHVNPLVVWSILAAVFISNTVLFVPLGQRIGVLFHQLPPLRAYSWDLGGSLAGTLAFGAFSLLYFSPVIGMAGVSVVYLILARGRARVIGLILLPLALVGVLYGTSTKAIWSPYHYVTVAKMTPEWPTVSEAEPNLRTMHDPPVYWMRVGRDFYQQHGTIDLSRYSPDSAHYDWMQKLHDQYLLPYQLTDRRDRVVVMGAGGGMDVEGALMAGARHVDAVEIDPVLVRLSHTFNSSGVYDDPRVRVHVNDARAHVRKMPGPYDLIVFGYLDSQSLFSSMTNLRMDSYIYTTESMRAAYEKLAPGGVMALSFAVPNAWLPNKLIQMVREGTGRVPLVYARQGTVVICVIKPPAPGQPAPASTLPVPPQTFGSFTLMPPIDAPAMDLPTDDWPYLYLSKRTIPRDYLIVIGMLLVFSIATVAVVRGTSLNPGDGHFFFLGLGFLLLQTKSITDCSLYFGTTWLVSNIVIAGVLLMVLAANLVAMRLRRPSRWFYLPLLASLLVLYFTPRDAILAHSLGVRLAWSLLVVPLPIFFAGLIFSTTFRESTNPSVSFGTNLIGATVGGFAEYLGMALGSNALSLIVIGAYAASYACLNLARARLEKIVAPAGQPGIEPRAEVT
jgi:SAM-dependent methyltransferase